MIKKTELKTISQATDGKNTYIIKEFADDKREIYSLLKEKNIRGIPKIYTVALSDSTQVIEEYIEGRSLFEIISKGEKLPLEEAKRIALETACVLLQLHSIGIIHRDIKPSNIVISNEGNVYIVDFDIARFYNPYSDKDTSLFGTAGYAPPEQFGFSSTDFKSDIYSYGMTIKDLFFFIGQPNQYKRIIEKCIEFDPKKRYSNMHKVIFNIKLKNALSFKKSFAFAILILILFGMFFSFSSSLHENIQTGNKDTNNPDISESQGFNDEADVEANNKKANSSNSKNRLENTSNSTSKNKDEDTVLNSNNSQPEINTISPVPEKSNEGIIEKEQEVLPPPVTCFYCSNPPITFFGDRRYCNEHAPKCTICGKIIQSGQSGTCEECTLAIISSTE